MAVSVPLANLLAIELPSDLAQQVVESGFTLAQLKTATKRLLRKHFAEHDVDVIYKAARRKPIPEETVKRLIVECDFKCCICWNIDSRDSVVIHHIEEHSKSHDDSYENLVVLCLRHHGDAHTKCDIARPPCPPDLLRARKAEWTRVVTKFRKGKIPPPGRTLSPDDPLAQSDLQWLNHMRSFLNRRAMRAPFRKEGNMNNFFDTMEKISLALTTGILKTRDGDLVARTKKYDALSNPNWRDRMKGIALLVESVLNRFETAVRDGELSISGDGKCYSFENPELPYEMDAGRKMLIAQFNFILVQAGLERIQGVEDGPDPC